MNSKWLEKKEYLEKAILEEKKSYEKFKKNSRK